MVGLVGESGCGKSVTSLAIMGLLPGRAARRSAGRCWFDGTDLLTLGRGRRCATAAAATSAMVFQDPLSSLNPVIPIGVQITEVLRRHRGMAGKKARKARPHAAGAGRHPRPAAAAASPTRTSSPAGCASAR